MLNFGLCIFLFALVLLLLLSIVLEGASEQQHGGIVDDLLSTIYLEHLWGVILLDEPSPE